MRWSMHHTEMPWFEKKRLCDQLQRAVVSISSNIAEGCAKPTDADFARFFDNSLGSAYEVETQLIVARNVGYVNEEQFNDLQSRNVAIKAIIWSHSLNPQTIVFVFVNNLNHYDTQNNSFMLALR